MYDSPSMVDGDAKAKCGKYREHPLYVSEIFRTKSSTTRLRHFAPQNDTTDQAIMVLRQFKDNKTLKHFVIQSVAKNLGSTYLMHSRFFASL